MATHWASSMVCCASAGSAERESRKGRSRFTWATKRRTLAIERSERNARNNDGNAIVPIEPEHAVRRYKFSAGAAWLAIREGGSGRSSSD